MRVEAACRDIEDLPRHLQGVARRDQLRDGTKLGCELRQIGPGAAWQRRTRRPRASAASRLSLNAGAQVHIGKRLLVQCVVDGLHAMLSNALRRPSGRRCESRRRASGRRRRLCKELKSHRPGAAPAPEKTRSARAAAAGGGARTSLRCGRPSPPGRRRSLRRFHWLRWSLCEKSCGGSATERP